MTVSSTSTQITKIIKKRTSTARKVIEIPQVSVTKVLHRQSNTEDRISVLKTITDAVTKTYSVQNIWQWKKPRNPVILS